MNWAKIYQDTVRHMLPQTEPYASSLRDFILSNRLPLTTWIAEAKVMLKGFKQTDNLQDLAMLAKMLERSSLAMLPARGIAQLIEDVIEANRKQLAIRCLSFDQLHALTPLEDQESATLLKDVASKVVSDIIRGTNFLLEAEANSRKRLSVDMTSQAHQAQIKPICEMAASLVFPFLPIDRLSKDMSERLAA